MESSQSLFRLIGFVPALIGVAMVAFSIRTGVRTSRIVGAGHRVTATVVDNRMHSGSESGVRFSPIVEYVSVGPGGDEVKVRTELQRFARSSFVPGTTFEVHYDPADPERAVEGRSAGFMIGIVFGLIFIGFGFAWFELASRSF